MANHLLINFVLVCLAATTTSSYRLDENAALKIRQARQCAKCPADSPELLSPWSDVRGPLEINERSARYHRATEVAESPKSEEESPTSGDSQRVTSSSSGIDPSRLTFAEDDKGDAKNSNKTKQRRDVSKYPSDDRSPRQILVSSSTGSNDRLEGRTFVLRRVDGTLPTTVVEDESTQASKYFARFDRLLAIYEGMKKFQEEYSKKTIYEYLEDAVHHVFRTIVFDHLPSLLLAGEAAVTDKVTTNSRSPRNGKRNCEDFGSSKYDSDEKNDRRESSGGRTSFAAARSAPEITMEAEPIAAEILQYSQEPRALEASESHSYEDSRDFEPNFRLGTVGTSGNRPFGSNARGDSATHGARRSSYGSEDGDGHRFPREPNGRFASNFRYRFPAGASEDEKIVCRRTAPIDDAKRAAKREAGDGRLPVAANDRDAADGPVNSEKSAKSAKSVDPVGHPESASPKDQEKSARIARSAALVIGSADAEKIGEIEKSGRFGRSENSAVVGNDDNSANDGGTKNSARTNETETTERIGQSRASTRLEGADEVKNLDETEESRKNEESEILVNCKKVEESERPLETPEDFEKFIYDELAKLDSTEKLDEEDAELIAMILARLKKFSAPLAEPANTTAIEKPSTIVTDSPTIDESTTDSPPPSTPV